MRYLARYQKALKASRRRRASTIGQPSTVVRRQQFKQFLTVFAAAAASASETETETATATAAATAVAAIAAAAAGGSFA